MTRIGALEEGLATRSDEQLRKDSLSLKYRAASGEPLSKLLVDAYALVREAARRRVKMRHYDVQVLGGIAMHHRAIAEMQTGEGKTLTATLPLYLAALTGKGAHLATANDYLAERDADLMRPVYSALGMNVGAVLDGMTPADRKKAYAADITYGTAKEFGFDFLRDRLVKRRIGEQAGGFGIGSVTSSSDIVQRDPHSILVDEADSILIDDARTPLIISALPTAEQERGVEAYRWSAANASEFAEDEHYEYKPQEKTVELLPAGRQLVRRLPKPDTLDSVDILTLYDHAERAIKVSRDFLLDRDYVVRDGEIVIIDESTGRPAEGRKWRAGIHQAVEAKEEHQGVEISVETGQAARITVQDFFQRYPLLCGMTGTASDSARELKKIYRLQVVAIPTNRPLIRQREPDAVFNTAESKWEAVAERVAELNAAGIPVLIGTRSIEKSEVLSTLLKQRGLDHEVLNARHLAREAEIVAKAGESGKITVATNMAGRGTDIKLGEGVAEIGGLHVIGTELHDSARIDRQLEGRCARQGDPGSYRQFMSLDDDVFVVAYGPKKARRKASRGDDSSANPFRRAQRRIQRRHFADRKILLYHERERRKMQKQMGQDPYLDTPG
ncbi:MAG: preprotein translocase subunit SecA [Pirellulales bacterium]|nr:preprotein translocase subunit SecA [Pirellulales bacterium]